MKPQSVEDYLKTIYQIQEENNGEPVSTSHLAQSLGITGASVTWMLKQLAAMEPKLVIYERYVGVNLTQEGQRTALEVIRHNRLIARFLNEVLGYPSDEVHEEAERLEHVISQRLLDRMERALGHMQNPCVTSHDRSLGA